MAVVPLFPPSTPPLLQALGRGIGWAGLLVGLAPHCGAATAVNLSHKYRKIERFAVFAQFAGPSKSLSRKGLSGTASSIMLAGCGHTFPSFLTTLPLTHSPSGDLGIPLR